MKSNPPIFNIPAPVGLIIAVMALVHLFRSLLSGQAEAEFLYRFAFIPARYGAAGFYPGGGAAEVWTVLSYAFLHGDVIHLAFNAIWLAGFGTALARRFGASRFLILFALGSAAGAAMHMLFLPNDGSPLVGASAGISAMIAATVRFAFAPGGPLAGGWGRPEAYRVAAPTLLQSLTNRRVVAFVGLWFILNMFFGLQNNFSLAAGNLIAWQAHMGGFLVGLLVFPLLDPVSPERNNSTA